MKKRTLYFVFFLFAFSSQAQSYVPFSTDTTTFWREPGYDYPNSSGPGATCLDYTYQISGDTTINGKTYHFLYKYGIIREEIGGGNCGKILAYINEKAGYFRNDSIHKKVWYQNPSEGINKDTLLYDFDLSIGDTLPEAYNNIYNYLVVDSIDTIQLNGTQRRRFFMEICHLNYDRTLIEGVGSSYGLLHDLGCSMQIFNELYCLSSQGKTIYPDSTTSCNLVTGIGEQTFKKEKRFEIYPNPTNGKVALQSEIQFQKIRVYNLQGQKVQEINPTFKRWELPKQNELYLIQLQDKNGRIYLEKVLKQ